MPKSSEEQAQARRDEIVNACAELYETMSFRDITLKEIGQRTSFTRTSIYNYFQTREEIFLALTQREYEAWTADLDDGAIRALQRCLQAYFPQMTEAEVQNFLYLFLPFMFGIYPYTSVTEKQREAMRLAQVSYPSFTVYELSRTFVEKVLARYAG